jgi:hypothetical protein
VPAVFGRLVHNGVANAPPVQVTLTTTLPQSPATIPIFQVIQPVIDSAYADKLAKSLGFSDAWPLVGTTRLAYSYTKGNQTLEINLSGYIRFQESIDLSAPTLPRDEDCINAAQNWLKAHGLFPQGPNQISVSFEGSVITADKTSGSASPPTYLSKVVRFIQMVNGYPCDTLGPSVTVGDQGRIIGAEINSFRYELYGLAIMKTPQAALNMLESYLSSPLAVPPESPECLVNYRVFDRLLITDVSIQYTFDNQGYLQPIFVFSGDALSSSGSNHFTGRVGGLERT